MRILASQHTFPAIIDIDATNLARAEIGLDLLTDDRITDAITAAGQ